MAECEKEFGEDSNGNVAEITCDQLALGFGGCDNQGIQMTSANFNGVMALLFGKFRNLKWDGVTFTDGDFPTTETQEFTDEDEIYIRRGDEFLKGNAKAMINALVEAQAATEETDITKKLWSQACNEQAHAISSGGSSPTRHTFLLTSKSWLKADYPDYLDKPHTFQVIAHVAVGYKWLHTSGGSLSGQTPPRMGLKMTLGLGGASTLTVLKDPLYPPATAFPIDAPDVDQMFTSHIVGEHTTDGTEEGFSAFVEVFVEVDQPNNYAGDTIEAPARAVTFEIREL